MPTEISSHSSIQAAWLILGKEICPEWPGWPLNVKQALAVTGAGRSQTYEMTSRLREAAGGLSGKAGRPAATAPEEKSLFKVSQAVIGYLMSHPGSAEHVRRRGRYSDGFRRFVVELLERGQPGEGLSAVELSEATTVPLSTLQEWLAGDILLRDGDPSTSEQKVRDLKLGQLIALFQSWKGTFSAFCKMVRAEYGLDYGPTFIGNLLEQVGLRQRNPQKGKASQWDRGTFRTLFPGAQWLGDGTDINIHGITVAWQSQTFTFNLEAILDATTNALVGFSVSDTENQKVLKEAFEDAVVTTGAPPLALSLDNRSSNHTQDVKDALGYSTTLLATTLGRGQSKAPLEGAFGLFNQAMPELIFQGPNPKELARSVLELCFTAWARGRNGRPRKRLGNRSPVEAYLAFQPSPEQQSEAKWWIEKLARRQEQLRRTHAARADGPKVELLKQGLADLNIPDPDGKLAVSLAYYSRDAIVHGLAVFRSKQLQGKIPDDAIPERYLGGIIRNADQQLELSLISEQLIKYRTLLRDLSQDKLEDDFSKLQAEFPKQLSPLIDQALKAQREIDYLFWTMKAVEALSSLDPECRKQSYEAAARKVGATFKADPRRRQSLTSRLAGAALNIN